MSSPPNAGTSSIVTGGTGAATRQANSDASKSVIARVPLHPRLTDEDVADVIEAVLDVANTFRR